MSFYKLIQGDCFDILPTIDDESIDVVLTDPPYNLRYVEDIELKDNTIKRSFHFDEKIIDIPRLLKACTRVLKNGGAFHFFCGPRQFGKYIEEMKKNNLCFSNFLVWYRGSGGHSIRKRSYRNRCELIVFGHKEEGDIKYVFNYKEQKEMTNLLEFAPSVSFEYRGGTPGEYLGHPTQKPTKLFQHLIGVSSNKNDVILDPFMGSGTTMFASQNIGRSCVGIEVEVEYIEMIKKRCFHRRFLDREVSYEFSQFR